MRLRVSLQSPFPPQKLLLPLPATLSTVAALKSHLISSLSNLSHLKKGKELVLEIDGFELLSGSLVGEVIREGDVITVRLAAESSKNGNVDDKQTGKRISKEIAAVVPAKKKKKLSTTISAVVPEAKPKSSRKTIESKTSSQPVAPRLLNGNKRPRSPSLSSSSSSDISSTASSSSSSASSSSSSSSTSSSSTSSSSSSSSTSCSPDLPAPPALPAQNTNPFPTLYKNTPNQSSIPPGLGKASTHDRNIRRRRARLLKKLEAEGQAPPASGSGGATPDKAINGTTTTFQVSRPIVSEMENRNKKKGFLREMKGLRGSRTVFEEPTAVPNGDADTAFPLEGPEDGEMNGTLSTAQKRVVPPSERQDLPSNVFVTSQEYDGKRDNGAWRNGRVASALEIPVVQAEAPNPIAAEVADEAEDVKKRVDWEKTEAEFDQLANLTVEKLAEVREGDLLAWKDLELDLYTFSPVLKLHIARVVSSSADEPRIKLEKLIRPVPEDWEEELSPVEEAEEPVIDKADFVEGRYKVV
ncbi:hypothetical protein P7C73_g5071, partial [Tremellales sp. Uapishka_1]